MKEGRKERNDKTVVYNYVSCDLTFVTGDSKSSYKSASDSRMSNSAVLIFFLNSHLVIPGALLVTHSTASHRL